MPWRFLRDALIAGALALLLGFWATHEISLSPLRAQPRDLVVAAAQTRMFVDTEPSQLTLASVDAGALARRALTFSQLLASDEIRSRVARRLGIAPYDIAVEGQTGMPRPREEMVVREEQRATQLLTRKTPYHLLFRADQGSSVIRIYTQAPTTEGAVRLADAAADESVALVQRFEEADGTARSPRRIILRKMQPAQGGVLNPGAVWKGFAMVGIGVWLAVMVALRWVARRHRERQRRDVLLPA